MRPVVQVPSSVPLVVPRQDDSPSATTESRRPDAPGPSELEIPKVEPLTPPLGPVRFPPPRQSHAYPNHPERQASIDPPAPEPIEFDDNPDVLAMRSAISLLQMQRVRAKNDMKALQKAKEAALADPEAFIKDLSSGKIKMGGSGLGSSMGDDYDEDDDDDSDDDSEDAEQDGVKNESGSTNIDKKPKRNKPELKPWSRLPSKQNVVRMPHINWSQYSVAGGSLDRLHNEQVSHPSQGTPATVGADGAYVFQGTGRQEEYRGIAAPYDPLKDKLIKKPKSKAPNRQG